MSECPSGIGLHSRDTARLIKVLKELQQLGNTVVVVEHDEEIMRAATSTTGAPRSPSTAVRAGYSFTSAVCTMSM